MIVQEKVWKVELDQDVGLGHVHESVEGTLLHRWLGLDGGKAGWIQLKRGAGCQKTGSCSQSICINATDTNQNQFWFQWDLQPRITPVIGNVPGGRMERPVGKDAVA